MLTRVFRLFGWSLAVIVLAATALPGASCTAQTLAHRGWVGSGITVAPWWKDAVFLEIDPRLFQASPGVASTSLHGILSQMDYLQALGVDAIVLSPFELRNAVPAGRQGRCSNLGAESEEEFGRVMAEASRRKIRIVADLSLNGARTAEELESAARFLLSRGVAGLRLTGYPQSRDAEEKEPRADGPVLNAFERDDRLRRLRLLAASYGVERVLLWDVPVQDFSSTPADDVAFPVSHHSRRRASRRVTRDGSRAVPQRREGASYERAAPQMVVDRRLSLVSTWSGNEVRNALLTMEPAGKRPSPQPVLVSDTKDRASSFARYADGVHDQAIAKTLATVLLASRGASLLRSGQELGGSVTPGALAVRITQEEGAQDSLLNWYRRLSGLRHSNAALRDGTMEMLATSSPDVVAWVRRAKAGGAARPAVIVVCNLSPHANWISLRSELRRLGVGLGDGRLHRLLSFATAGGDAEETSSVDSLSLPADGVFLGEIRSQPGLETVVLPARRSHRRSR